MTLTQSLTKLKNIAIIVIILLLLGTTTYFGVSSYITSKKLEKTQSALAERIYNNSMPFTQKVLKDSSSLVKQNQLLIDENSAFAKKIEKLEHLKSLNSQVVYKTITEIKEIKVPYIDSAKLITKVDSITKDSTQYLQVPARAQVITKDYQIDETVMSDGIEVNHILFPDSTTNIIGNTGNLFKDEPSILIKHSNPFIKTLDIKNIVIKPKVTKSVQTFLIGGVVGVSIETILVGTYYYLTHK